MKNDEAIKKDRHRQYGDKQKPKGEGQKRRTGKLRRRLGKKAAEESAAAVQRREDIGSDSVGSNMREINLYGIRINSANAVLASFGMCIGRDSLVVYALPDDEALALEDLSDDQAELPESDTGG